MVSSRKRQPPATAAPEEANAALNEPRRTPGRFRAIVYAALVHALVIAALIIGFRWSSSPSVAPETTIQATVAEDPEKKKQEEERRQQQEEERKAQAERKRQEAEAQKQEEARRLEERRKQAETEKQKQAEAKRKEEERKKAEARKKREEEVQQRKAAEDSLKQQLAEEERARAQAANAARAASELKKYEGRIQQKVKENWVPVGDDPRLQCVVRVRLAVGGVVLEANIVKGSGNAEFDRSVPPAVLKASPLPLPPERELFEYYREITFTFRPQ